MSPVLFESKEREGVPDGERAAEPREPSRTPRTPEKRDKPTKQIYRRRASAIHAYIGPNGSGKTLAMVRDSLPTLSQRWVCSNPDHAHTGKGITSGIRRVLSTARIFDAERGELHEHFELLTEWTQVLEAEHCDLLFDEVTGIAGSRESMGMPVAVQNILQQLRHRDVQMRWTAPSWKRADSIIRSCSIAVTVCRGFWPDRSAVVRSETPPAWLPNRLFKLRTFAALDFEEWTAEKGAQDKRGKSKMKAEIVEWFMGPGSLAFASYDTLGAVSRIGEVLDGGRCAHCGGRRPVPLCKCG